MTTERNEHKYDASKLHDTKLMDIETYSVLLCYSEAL